MKRSPIARRTPLKASNNPLKRSSIRRRSKRTESLYSRKNGRREFVAVFLADNPRCQIQSPDCTTYSQSVHEKLKRSAGGAIIPGEKADRQNQEFFSACFVCNEYIERFPKWAKEMGFSASRHAVFKSARDSLAKKGQEGTARDITIDS